MYIIDILFLQHSNFRHPLIIIVLYPSVHVIDLIHSATAIQRGLLGLFLYQQLILYPVLLQLNDPASQSTYLLLVDDVVCL